jgi:dTDP-4-dehydrorhamnose 3,5-epimerase
MIFKDSKIKGLKSCILNPIYDDRGYFLRTYDNEFIGDTWLQENQSYSSKKGTIRGFHLQLPPYSETKIIRVVCGSAYMVFVDLREGSDTFGQYVDYTISKDNPTFVYIPRGLACGICTLEDNTIISYKMDNIYNQESAVGIKWDDPDLNIPWPKMYEYTISIKDKSNMSFKKFKGYYKAIKT